MNECMYECMYVCIHTNQHVASEGVFMYVCYECMYTFVCICVYVCAVTLLGQRCYYIERPYYLALVQCGNES
jgi:hypothetical protein